MNSSLVQEMQCVCFLKGISIFNLSDQRTFFHFASGHFKCLLAQIRVFLRMLELSPAFGDGTVNVQIKNCCSKAQKITSLLILIFFKDSFLQIGEPLTIFTSEKLVLSQSS